MSNVINLNDFKNEKTKEYNIEISFPDDLKETIDEIILTELEDLKLKLLDCIDSENESGTKFIKHMIRQFNTIKKRIANNELLSFENINSLSSLCCLRIEQMSLYISFLEEPEKNEEDDLLNKITQIFKIIEDVLSDIKNQCKEKKDE